MNVLFYFTLVRNQEVKLLFSIVVVETRHSNQLSVSLAVHICLPIVLLPEYLQQAAEVRVDRFNDVIVSPVKSFKMIFHQFWEPVVLREVIGPDHSLNSMELVSCSLEEFKQLRQLKLKQEVGASVLVILAKNIKVIIIILTDTLTGQQGQHLNHYCSKQLKYQSLEEVDHHNENEDCEIELGMEGVEPSVEELVVYQFEVLV